MLSIDLGDPVALTIENTPHYSLNSSESDAEYKSIYPGDLGFFRLGPERRFFGISMYHQLHCLDSLRSAIVYGPDWHGHHDRQLNKRAQVPHVHHCLNYLRQTILCSADLTLEPEISPQEVGEGLGMTHVCRDWSKVHNLAQKNWDDYLAWRTHQGPRGSSNTGRAP